MSDSHPSSGSQGKGSQSSLGWLFLSVALVVAAGSAVTINLLQERGDEFRRMQTELALLRADAHDLEALEWETIFKQELNEESSARLEKIQTRMDERFSRLGLLASSGLGLEEVIKRYRAYVLAVDQEFKLIAAAKIKEAEEFDETNVDPAFDTMLTALVEAGNAYDKMAIRTLGQVRAGTLVALLGAMGLIVLLVLQFNKKRSMVEVAAAEQAALRQANEKLEARVRERTTDLEKTNDTLEAEISARQGAQDELENVHKQLLKASHRSGMAEIAANVLHNVGNVLNSVNVSASLVVENVRKSNASGLAKAVGLIREHEGDLGTFVTSDPRGKLLPTYLAQFSENLIANQETSLKELDSVRGNIEHIKEIVTMQQSYARVSGVKEIVNIKNLVEDSLRMNANALGRHGVELIREFEDVPLINIDKHKVLQILVNLVRNAKYACEESGRADKRLTVRVENGGQWLNISVIDNGVGIPQENLTRIFNHGFTTRKDGHGFGLHSGALAAKEMGGSLTVHSDGVSRGATFTLKLPSQPERHSHG